MPFQAIASQRLYQQVADQIGDLIRSGEFASGDRLPPERDLAKKLGVSRPVVREAMIALEIEGLVEVRVGAGTYVRPARPSSAAGHADAGPSPFEILSARKMIEGEIAEQAAAAMTPSLMAPVEEALTLMRAATMESRSTLETDRLFHVRIAEATGNQVLVAMVDELWQAMLSPVFDALRRVTGLPKKDQMTLKDHSDIVAALAARDGATARRLMREHIDHVEAILLAETPPA